MIPHHTYRKRLTARWYIFKYTSSKAICYSSQVGAFKNYCGITKCHFCQAIAYYKVNRLLRKRDVCKKQKKEENTLHCINLIKGDIIVPLHLGFGRCYYRTIVIAKY